VFLVLIAAAVLVTLPFRPCPDCEGGGKSILLLPASEPSDICRRCSGSGRLSLVQRWRSQPQQTYVGAADMTGFITIDPILKSEGIPRVGGSASLGVIEFSTDTPQHARRARELIAKDAQKNGYRFWYPGVPSPWK